MNGRVLVCLQWPRTRSIRDAQAAEGNGVLGVDVLPTASGVFKESTLVGVVRLAQRK